MSERSAIPRDESRIREFAHQLVREARKPRAISALELLAMQLPQPKFLIEDVLTGPGAWLVVGSHKAGKTILSLQLAIALETGSHFLEWFRTLERRPALIIEQDDPAGLATVQAVIARSPERGQISKLFVVDKPNFTIGPDLFAFIREQAAKLDVGLVVLDSYTRMRPARGAGVDVVKAESADFTNLDSLAKELDCTILVVHHRSHGRAGLDWSEQAAGTYAIGAAVEGQIHISRFSSLPSTAHERLVQIRGRRFAGREFVVRFRPETLDYELILDGPAASVYAEFLAIQAAFGSRRFTIKDVCHQVGFARSTAHRVIARLVAAGCVKRIGYGDYAVASGTRETVG